jgi:hypothetical protein
VARFFCTEYSYHYVTQIYSYSRHADFIEKQSGTSKLASMMKQPLLLMALLITACGLASAGTLLVSASGQFSSTDTADSLVAPNGLFSLAFSVDSNPTPLEADSLGFDVPVNYFAYDLNGVPVSVTPSEIRFDTLANGGLFDVTIGSGLTEDEFEFEGDQAFSGTTAVPVFATGQYDISELIYSDPDNFDFPATSATASIGPTPEPSTILLISGGLVVLIGRKFRVR